jgi:hypothetical protein
MALSPVNMVDVVPLPGVFPAKFESLSGGLTSQIVRMNDETRAKSSWAILETLRQDNIDVITGITFLIFWKHVDKMEILWIPNDCDRHFAIPHHVFHLSGGIGALEPK